MIVDPDFVDHWKTRMLVDLLDFDEAAPIYVIRLWAHCQSRRAWEFDLTAETLRSICRFRGDAKKFESAMVESKWIRRDGTAIIVLEWEVYNQSLIASWSNGKKGGRPRKAPNQNPQVNPPETHGITQGKPMGSPATNRSDGIRSDEMGLDESIPAAPDVPPEKPEEPKPRKPAVETWLTPYGDIWFQVFEGEMPFTVFARDLKKLETKHGKVMVAVRWRRYCEAHVGKAQFANAAKFAQTYGQWSEDAVNAEHDPRGNIAAGKRFKEKMRQQAHDQQGKTLEGSDIIEGEIITK